MPRLSSIGVEQHDFYIFPTIKWFPEAANHKGLARGGVYLLSGPPGSGKTTIALEMMVDLSSCGYKILYVTLEQSPGWLKNTIESRIFPHRRNEQSVEKRETGTSDWKKQLKAIGAKIEKEDKKAKIEEIVENNLFIDSSVSSMDDLPDFLMRQVLASNAQYKGTQIIVVDSLQGLGTAPTSSRPYARLYEFNRWAKEDGITCLLIGHITKSGQIAGPRSLEHNVDCVFYIRKAMRLRPLFVPKNRFGPERHEPYTLITNRWGCLEKSRHMTAVSTTAYGYLPGLSERLAEVQALVKLPKYGARPGILAPYLPRPKLQQVIGIVSSLKDVDISDLTFEINCYIPSGGVYSHTLDFPLAISMLSSYFQRPLPSRSLFIGELDLTQQIRPLPDESMLQALSNFLVSGQSRIEIERIFISAQQSTILSTLLSSAGSRIQVNGVSSLEEVITSIWPDIVD